MRLAQNSRLTKPGAAGEDGQAARSRNCEQILECPMLRGCELCRHSPIVMRILTPVNGEIAERRNDSQSAALDLSFRG